MDEEKKEREPVRFTVQISHDQDDAIAFALPHMFDNKGKRVRRESFVNAFLAAVLPADSKKIVELWENIEKLKKRYPDGFSTERSMNRGKE